MITTVRRRRLRALAVLAPAVTALSVLVVPGTAAATGGDPDCLTEEHVPESGVALSRQNVVGNSTVHAFGTGTDSQVWTRQMGGTNTGWQSLGGVSSYGPAAVFSGSTHHVLVVGGDGAVWTRSNAGGGWGGWTSLGGYFVTGPAAASLGDGHLRVFGTGADSALWTNEFAGGRWSGWYGLGGQLVAAPVATTYPAFGQVEVSVMGTDGLIWTMGLGQGARSGRWVNRDFASCSVLATPSVSLHAFPEGRAYLDYDWSMRTHSLGYDASFGGFFVSNPDVELVIDRFNTGANTLVAIGGDGAMWARGGAVRSVGWVSLGGQFI